MALPICDTRDVPYFNTEEVLPQSFPREGAAAENQELDAYFCSS